MAISDVYTVDSGLIAQASTSQTPILEYRAGSTKRGFIVGVRMSIGVTAAAAGNAVTFTLARAGNSPSGGSGSNLIRPNDAASAAAINTAFIGTWTIAPTLGAILGEWELPQTTGSAWEEFPPLGYEWVVGASTSVVGFVTTSVATSTPVGFQFVVSE